MMSYFTRLIERAAPTGLPGGIGVAEPRREAVNDLDDPFETAVSETLDEPAPAPVSVESRAPVSRSEPTQPEVLERTAPPSRMPTLAPSLPAEEIEIPSQVVQLDPPVGRSHPVEPAAGPGEASLQNYVVPSERPSAGIKPPEPRHDAAEASEAARSEPLARAEAFMRSLTRDVVTESAPAVDPRPTVEVPPPRVATADAVQRPPGQDVAPLQSLQPTVASVQLPSEPLTPREAPRLVIGRLSVEVLPQQREPAPAAPRLVIIPSAGSASVPRPSSQRFGLGQV
jgi:hypothetical protein